MKNKFYFAIVLIFLAVIVILTRGTSPSPAAEDIKGVKIGGEKIRVELADTPKEREQGLSGRAGLKEGEGMLFVFEQPGKYYFWMKDMNFAIDMIWLAPSSGGDQEAEIIYIKKNAEPENFLETYCPDANAKYVLEMNAGFADKTNLQLGDRVEF